MPTRRRFLRSSVITAGLLGTAPAWLLRAAAGEGGRRKMLVVVFLRGAADGLSLVPPFSESRYHELRPGIRVPPPGSSNGPPGAVDLDGRFALHPALRPLESLWTTRQLAIVHAVGSPDPTRSHFEAQEFMESGTPGRRTDEGWLNRALPLASDNASPIRAVAIGTQVPRTLRGDRGAVAVDDLSTFRIGDPDMAAILERLYASSGDSRLGPQGRGAFEAVRTIEAIRGQTYRPADGAQYAGAFGQRLMRVAHLLKAGVGVEVAFVDFDGWDHHVNASQQLWSMLRELGGSLTAFARDMGDRMADVVLVTMSEFGRTAAENGTGGTDHGRGGVMMVIGGAVRGGSVYGRWPGLEPEQLEDGRDLAVTTDFRDVLGELVRDHLGQDPAPVFPGHMMGEPLNLVAS